jgi:hypothetical protein
MAVCFGTHRQRGHGASPLTGAEVVLVPGAADASWGILVLVGGYGSESPAFGEPAFLRDTTLAEPQFRVLLERFRYRVIVRLHGGFGWRHADTLAIADSLDRYLHTDPLAGAAGAGPCVVIAHSRGTQIVAATPCFRTPAWRRFAVHPPAAVNPLLRLLSWMSPEIAEIQHCGKEMARNDSGLVAAVDSATARLVGFPWTVMYQAHGWDHTVIRFPAAPGRPLSNLSPWGSHTLPFCASRSRVWQDITMRLRNLA